MSNDNVIDFEVKVAKPRTETASPEGYRLKHMDFGDINAPQSSNPFPYVRFHYHNGDGSFRIQRNGFEHEDIQISKQDALRMARDLLAFVTVKGSVE